MKVAGVIPARWGSTRLPGKSLTPLCGKPLVLWVAERARLARRLDLLVVATDDARIADRVRGAGFDVAMTDPAHASGTDRVAEAVAGRGADIVINIQGDEPLIDPALIDRLAAVMADEPETEMATAATLIREAAERDNPAVVKVVCDGLGRALYFSRSVIPHVRDPGSEDAGGGPLHWRHIGIYAYQTRFLERFVHTPPSRLERTEKLEQLRALHIGGRIRVLETDYAGVGVDTPADVARAEDALRQMGLA